MVFLRKQNCHIVEKYNKIKKNIQAKLQFLVKEGKINPKTISDKLNVGRIKWEKWNSGCFINESYGT